MLQRHLLNHDDHVFSISTEGKIRYKGFKSLEKVFGLDSRRISSEHPGMCYGESLKFTASKNMQYSFLNTPRSKEQGSPLPKCTSAPRKKRVIKCVLETWEPTVEVRKTLSCTFSLKGTSAAQICLKCRNKPCLLVRVVRDNLKNIVSKYA